MPTVTEEMKKKLMKFISQAIDNEGYSTQEAAIKLGIDQSKTSRLLNHKMDFFGIDVLAKYCKKLGGEVNLEVTEK